MSLSKPWKPWTSEEKDKVLQMANDPFTKYTLDEITSAVPGRTRDAVQGVISRGRKKDKLNKNNNIANNYLPNKRKRPVGSENGIFLFVTYF
jgi:hypothetical protein